MLNAANEELTGFGQKESGFLTTGRHFEESLTPVNLVSLTDVAGGNVTYPLQIPTMSTADDPERQPLLPSRQQSVESSQITGNVTIVVTNDDPLPVDADTSKPDPEEKAQLSTILWYTTFVAAGTVALVLFIKSFIDAGDTEVSLLYPSLHAV
jgi:hypothetical protein